MRKVVVILLVLLVLFTYIDVYAIDENMTFHKIKSEMLQNNTTLKKLLYATYKAQNQYENALKGADQISIYGIKENLGKIGRKLDPYDEMLLIMQRDFMPAQAKYYWELSQSNEKITINTLTINLRNLYLGLINGRYDLAIKQQRLSLAEEKYKQAQSKFMNGLISKLDLDQADYDLQKVKNDLIAAKRNIENTSRTLNNFIGKPFNITYNNLSLIEEKNTTELKPIEDYIELALKQRYELIDLQKQIDLDKKHMDILDLNNVSNIYLQSREDYAGLKNNIDASNLKMDRTKLDIENEIKSALMDIKKENSSLNNLKKTIANQEQNLTRINAQFKAGYVTNLVIQEFQIGINGLKNSYNLSVYNYNTKLMKLEYATGIGPAY